MGLVQFLVESQVRVLAVLCWNQENTFPSFSLCSRTPVSTLSKALAKSR